MVLIVHHFTVTEDVKNPQQGEWFFPVIVKDISQNCGNWIRVKISTRQPKGQRDGRKSHHEIS